MPRTRRTLFTAHFCARFPPESPTLKVSLSESLFVSPKVWDGHAILSVVIPLCLSVSLCDDGSDGDWLSNTYLSHPWVVSVLP